MRRTSFLATALSVLALTTSPGAQTTHVVSASGLAFEPTELEIDVGDTVRWVWGSGLHNVESGVNGIPDGAFASGLPVVAPASFEVLFDEALLDAHPRAGNEYRYYCIVHLSFGMEGRVRVRTPASSTVRNGSGTNPAGFAEVTPPVLGATWSTTVELAGAVASFVAVSDAPLLLPSAFGELLVDPAGVIGPIHVAAGAHAIAIPDDRGLLGLRLSSQAATFLPGRIQLQNALDLRLGI